MNVIVIMISVTSMHCALTPQAHTNASAKKVIMRMETVT